MKKPILIFYWSIILFICSVAMANDSLYLVNTLVGESGNRLHNAKAAGDINGNGYDDLAIMYDDSTYLYYGNPTFELYPDLSIPHTLSFPGDINNDGYADFIFTKTNEYDNLEIYLGFGGAYIDTSGILIYEQQYTSESFSTQVDPLGDVNGDGFNDFVISSPYNWSDGISRVYLYLGGDTISSEPEVVFTSGMSHLYEDFFGHAVTGIGDQNNDGYDDFLISAPNEPFVDSTVSRVYLYYGGSEINSTADSILTFPDIEFGFNLKNVGDINNDNSPDFAVTSYDSCVIYFNFDSIMTTRFYGSGHGIGGNGDINNDSIMDLIIGDPSYKDNTNNYIGRFDIYNGENNFSLISDYANLGEQYGSLFAQYADFIGDFNDDGYDDVYAVATTFREDDKEIGKLYLYSFIIESSITKPKVNRINNFQLYQNYPNPFNPKTTIRFALPYQSEVRIQIFNILGQKIKTLNLPSIAAGYRDVVWDGKNNFNSQISSGLYIYRFEAKSLENKEHFIKTSKMLFLK